MQNTAVFNIAAAALPANTPWMPRASRLLRTLGRRCDLFGVLSLMGSSAAYGVYALAHLGF